MRNPNIFAAIVFGAFAGLTSLFGAAVYLLTPRGRRLLRDLSYRRRAWSRRCEDRTAAWLHSQRFPTICALLISFAGAAELFMVPALRVGLYGPPILRIPYMILVLGGTAWVVWGTLRAIEDVRTSPWMAAQRLINGQ